MRGSFFSSAVLNSSPTVASLQLGPQMCKSFSNNFLCVLTPQEQFLSGQKKPRVSSQLLLSYTKETKPDLQCSIIALGISLVLFFQNPRSITAQVEGDSLLRLHSLRAVLPAKAALIPSCGSSSIGRYIQSPLSKSITKSLFKNSKQIQKGRIVVAVLPEVLGYRSKRWKSPAIFHLVGLPKHKAELFPSSITCGVFLLRIKVTFITYLLLQSHWDSHVTIAANEVAQLCPKVWPR